MADKDNSLKPRAGFLKPLINEAVIIGIALIIGIGVFEFVWCMKQM